MKKILIIMLVSCMAIACTKDFARINKNPYGIGSDVLSTIPVGGNALLDLQIYVLPDQENSYQMCMDLPGVLSGYCSATGFIDDYNAYAPRVGWNDYPYVDTYKHLYKNFNPIKIQTNADFKQPAFCLATIMRVAITHRLVDMYGPLPYSGVNGIDLQVEYEKVEDLYPSMIEDLKLASEALDKLPDNYDKYAPYDHIYKGDMKKWATYARSLMLRLAVRMGDKLPEKAKEYAEYAVASGVILTNEQNALYESNDNPAYKVSVSWGDSRVCADIVEYMKAFHDGRTDAYFTKVASRGDVAFGLRNGNVENIKGTKLDKYSSPNIQKNSPIVWMSAAEVHFLMAEAALKDWNMGMDAKSLYEKGIRLSFEQWHSELGDYLSSTSKRGGFTDVELPKMNDNNFSSPITVSWDDANGDKAKQLSKIITQKWIAMFPYNTIEAWTEWRRTGYPNLMPIVNNKSAGLVPGITQENGRDRGGMRRLKFAAEDALKNAENLNKGIGYLGGEDSFTTDIWWAKTN